MGLECDVGDIFVGPQSFFVIIRLFLGLYSAESPFYLVSYQTQKPDPQPQNSNPKLQNTHPKPQTVTLRSSFFWGPTRQCTKDCSRCPLINSVHISRFGSGSLTLIFV